MVMKKRYARLLPETTYMVVFIPTNWKRTRLLNDTKRIPGNPLASDRACSDTDRMDTIALLSLEARAARMAAILDARPNLGRVWRHCVLISEASATLSLEDVRVRESSVGGIEGAGLNETDDPQAVATARSIATVLKRPGTLLEAPEKAFYRCLKAARMSSLVDTDRGGRAAWAEQDNPEEWGEAVRLFADVTPDILRHDAPILSRLLLFAETLSQILPENLPTAERLLFMVADHTMRQQEALAPSPFSEKDPFPTQARWVLTPALALSRGGLRSWSPGTKLGREGLILRLDHALWRDIGRLTALEAWREKLAVFGEAKSKGGACGIFANYLSGNPIITSEKVARLSNLTERAARNLIARAEEEGLVELVTPRRSYRVWTAPFLAEMIRDRDALDKVPHYVKTRPAREMEMTEPLSSIPTARAETPDFSKALATLDTHMAEADKILEKYQARASARANRDSHDNAPEEDLDDGFL